MAKPLEYNATLVERIDLSDSLAIFRFRPDEELAEAPWFVPGQYVVIGLNNEDKPELGKVQRPMSIASSPMQREFVEFYIRFVSAPASDNPLTHLLWKLKEGERSYVRFVPKGRFTVDHLVGLDDPRRKVFVGAGTGLAPFVSIVAGAVESGRTDLSEYAIVHGASYPADIGYRDQLEQYQRDYGMGYLPTISRPQEGDGWTGGEGRAEEHFRAHRIEELETSLGFEVGGLTPENATVFVCGLQGTIGMTIERLLRRAFVPEHRGIRKALEVDATVPSTLFFEQYDHEPVIDLKDVEHIDELKDRLSP